MIKYLNIDPDEFSFQFQSHPNYPSVLAFSDTLNFMGIKNEVYELEKQYWDELPEEFITIYKNNLSLIKKDKKGYHIITNKQEDIADSDLLEHTNNIVLLFEKSENQLMKHKLNYNISFYFLIFSILFFSLFQFKWYYTFFNFLSILGVFISLEIFNKKFGKESKVINNICGSTNENTLIKSCAKIIDSDTINIWGLKLSDFSLIYFLALFVLGVFFPFTGFALKILSFSSIAVIVYSLFAQIFIEKAFCRICLLIIILLLGQIIISYLFFPFIFSLKIFIISLLAFVISLFTIIFINDILKQKDKYKKLHIKNLKFKRNYEIFKRQLQEQKVNLNRYDDVFWLGSKNAKLNISIITNPFCGYCKEAHIILQNILIKYPQVSAQFRFNYFKDTAGESLTKLISAFKNIYDKAGENELLKAIELWYDKRDFELFQKKYSLYLDIANLSQVIKMAEENLHNGLSFTPVFIINNYRFPQIYDREDILYFIDELLEDEDFNYNKAVSEKLIE